MTPERRFLHRLALALGRTTRELAAQLGAREFRQWRDYYALEPWDGRLHAGLIAATLANCRRGPDTPPFRPADFMPGEAPREEPAPSGLSPDEWIARLTDGDSLPHR